MAARALTFFKGQWLEGNPGIIGPMSHCMWLSSVVFDGARAFEGATPDLDLHCERVIASGATSACGGRASPSARPRF